MKPSEIRQIILDEHAHLRRRIATIEASFLPRTGLEAPAGTAPARGLDLAREIAELHAAFLSHLATEAELLRVVLVDVDTSGPMRLEEMDREHAEQREALTALIGLQRDSRDQDARLRHFLGVLRADLDAEERDLLDVDVLRDDSISIDAFGG